MASIEMADTKTFDMTEMGSALGGQGQDGGYQGRPPTIEEASRRARDHGYGERVDYDYTQTEATRRVANFTRCDWIATGELGVYAPRIPELEKELYPEDVTYGKGLHMDVLENVVIEVIGEDPVKPVETVGHPLL
jgi:hypothetical protein